MKYRQVRVKFQQGGNGRRVGVGGMVIPRFNG